MVSVSPMAGLPGNNWSRDSTPSTTTRRPSLLVVIGHQAAFLHLERAKALVVRPYAAHRPRGRVVAADFGDAAPQFGAHRLDQVGFVLDGVCILNRKAHRTSRGVATGLCAGAAAPDDRQVDADRFEPFFLVAAESLAQADQQNDRGDAPDDSEHGQEAAQFVRGDRGRRLLAKLP